MLHIKQIEFNSPDYNKSVELRDKILRKPLNLVFTPEYLAAEYDQVHLAAFIDTKIVGTLLIKPLDDKTIQMRQVSVDENLQGKGIGRQLVAFCEKYAIENRFSRIILHARKEALGFYKKLNYQVVSDKFLEVGIYHYEMQKILT